jgi:hypothetical protein
MHFKGIVIQPDDEINTRMPFFKFQESLYLEYNELRSLEELLRKLIFSISDTLFQIAQTNPTKLERYRAPKNSG